MFKKMNIRTKLAAEFALLLVIVLSISAFAVVTTFRINREHSNMLAYPSARVQIILRIATEFTELRRLSTSVAAWTGNVLVIPELRCEFYTVYDRIMTRMDVLEANIDNDPHLTNANRSQLLAELAPLRRLVASYNEEIAEPNFVAAMLGDIETVLSFGPAGYPIHREITTIYTLLMEETQQTIYEISTGMNTTAINMMIAMSALVLIAVFVSRRNEKSKVSILHQNELQESHIMQLTENQEQIKMLSHDFKQKVETIRTLNDTGKYEELTAYIKEISHSQPAFILIDTGNAMLDAILSSKESEATRNSIDFALKMDIPQGLPNITVAVCTMLGNALDNAIEACLRTTISNRFIRMEIRATKTQFLCRIVNALGEPPKPSGNFLKTSKADHANHGMGLKSMKQTCDILGGDFSFEYTDTDFEIQIYLPIEAKPRS